MKLIMTLMVRDEADIIAPMIDHHLAQGLDKIIVTDNGSVDGTYEILQGYGDAIDLRLDPVHRKQQHSVVTAMAREAYTRYGADWVINADADEFWMPTRHGQTMREVFENLPKSMTTFTVPVIDMTGAPAQRGSGLQRLTYRDTRPTERLRELGLKAHSTPDAVHIGDPTVEVTQGNHAVNLAGNGDGYPQPALEVLHFPWRSWEQFERKVRDAGRAYDNNPLLLPSPNHHGMREYRRWKAGTLFAFYVLRHPSEDELRDGEASGQLVLDTRIADSVGSPIQDELLSDAAVAAAREYGPKLNQMELDLAEQLSGKDDRIAELLRYVDEGKQYIDKQNVELHAAAAREGALGEELGKYRSRKIVKLVDAARAALTTRHP